MSEQGSVSDDLPTILPPEEYLEQILAGRGSEVDRTAREKHILLAAARALVRTRQAEQFAHELEVSGLDIRTYFGDRPDIIERFRGLGLIE